MRPINVSPGFASLFMREVLRWARNNLELTTEEIARFLGITSVRTTACFKGAVQELNPQEWLKVENLFFLMYLTERNIRDKHDPHAIFFWVNDSVPALRGRSPKTAILEGDIESVISMLASLESGAHI